MIKVKIKKGYDLNISGKPSSDIEKRGKPQRIAVLPERIPFIKPRLRVAAGDRVNIGSPLFEDKRDPDIVFLSPGGGRIESVNYGTRRVIREIVIKLDDDEGKEEFPFLESAEVTRAGRGKIVDLLVKGGLWPLIRELPFRDIAGMDNVPPSIIVTLDSMDCFFPSPEVYLKGNESLFGFGIDVLKQLSDTVLVALSGDIAQLPESIATMVTHNVSGPYPAHDPGALLYHIKKSHDENQAWYLDGQDLLLMASFLKTGQYPVEKIYAVGGGESEVKTHVKARIGSPASLLSTGGGTNFRYISGGILKGYTLPPESYLGYYESSLVLLPEGDEELFFGFIRPGYGKPSFSKTFLSFFNRSDINMSCNMNGELRACINCGTCERVCPVDILPQFTLKCIEADEIEEALEHGLLDCVECGLCTYVCPSKIELNRIFNTARAEYSKERA